MTNRFLALLLCAFVAAPAIAADVAAKPVTVFGAASLTNALGELGQAYTAAGGAPIRFSFAASSTLARQIESGAGAELFVSADEQWMDYLEQRGLIRAATRRDLLGNRLALIAPADSTITLEIGPGFPLAAALGGGRLATGDPDNVPAGRYARAALTSLGAWDSVADRLVRAEDVRTALAFVARGEAPLGIVYATDAAIEKKVRVVGLFPEDSHPRIIYPLALTNAAGDEAAKFAEFLGSDAARAVFERLGFVVLR
jgi:molybdate transport system substrate-binding protein